MRGGGASERIHSTPPTYILRLNLENRTQVIHQTCVCVYPFSHLHVATKVWDLKPRPP